MSWRASSLVKNIEASLVAVLTGGPRNLYGKDTRPKENGVHMVVRTGRLFTDMELCANIRWFSLWCWTRALEMNALITLGSTELDELSFAGSITRVHVWSRVLDFDSEIPMMVVSCHGSEKCPSDQFVLSSQREINVTWPEPEFQTGNEMKKIQMNFKQGQVFTWGEYDVLYVAQDNASNTAECNFKIHISREQCPQLEEPVNGVQACESWGPQLRYKACSIECREGYEFSRPPAVFYTCAADGLWRPRLRNQLIFRYPQCTKDPIQNSVSGQKSKVVDVLENEIINQGAFNLEKVLPNGRPDLTSFQLLDEFHCQSGQVTVDDVCVPCAPGSFHSILTSQCELCPEGEYQPLAGRTDCFKCPADHITAGQGAVSENECK
ncbi:GCC2 and GCC3, partial [Cooperia oncophora]